MSDRKIIMSLDSIMGDRYAKYAKYIIQDRALPDVRDGLKPVQRRILYSMFKENNIYTKAYRKSAKTVGNVIGNYHPHGDSSVYEAMVRLSQDWKIRAPLIDMQGNNGSIDNDPAAAMRYTEARLSAIAAELLADINKDTVQMSLNFDDTEYEPTVLPAGYPNLLVNGATGISSGYATDIPPHNLEEVIDATIHRIQHPDCTITDIMQYIHGPDFPTGAIVEGKEGILQAFKTGKGKVIIRAKSEIVKQKTIQQIVITEIPYEVNKAELVRKIDEYRYQRTIDGILEIRDESDRNGLRIVIDVKKEVSIENTLNYFYKNTDLQKNYNYNMVAIKDKRPEVLGIIAILDGYIAHQEEVVTRSCQFDLKKARERVHIVDGLIKAISMLDAVVQTIRSSKNKENAKQNLMATFAFTEKQAEAIVMLQLYRLTNTDIASLQDEQQQLQASIASLLNILENKSVLDATIIHRLKTIKQKYPMPRFSEIREEVQDIKIDEQAMIIAENTHISLTHDGYIKRISNRSLKASEGTPFGKKENDILLTLLPANTIDHILAFTNTGKYIFIPVFKIEEFKWKDVGKHISYLAKIEAQEKIIEAIVITDFSLPLHIILATKNGQMKRTNIADYKVSRYSKAMCCIKLKTDDFVVSIALTNGNQDVLVTSKLGFACLYNESELTVTGIKAGGTRGMKLQDSDTIVSLQVCEPEKHPSLIILSQQGAIKRLRLQDIPRYKKGSKGIQLFKNPKSKVITVAGCFICDMQDTLYIIDETYKEHSIPIKQYAHVSLEQKPSPVKTIEYPIVYGSIRHPLTTANMPCVTKDDTKQKKPIYEPITLEEFLQEREEKNHK